MSIDAWRARGTNEKKNMKKNTRSRPKQDNQAPSSTDQVSASINDFNFWRSVAEQVVPGETDKWRVGEVACILQQTATRIGEHFRKVSSICNHTEAKSISISIPVKIARMNTPPEVFVGIKYSEKYGDGLTVKVPDPEQTELPMTVERGHTADQVETEAKGGKKEKSEGED